MLHLHKLLHVPKIKKNVLSVSRFAKDNNVYFEFHNKYCLVKSQVTKQVLLKGIEGHEGLYAFILRSSRAAVKSHVKNLQQLTAHKCKHIPTVNHVSHNTKLPSDVASSSNLVSSLNVASNSNVTAFSVFDLWQSRLGHTNVNNVHLILKLCNISIPNKKIVIVCKSCCLGKSHKIHAPSSDTVYTKAFELVHTDLWSPSPSPSKSGYNYYISFVDTFTKYI